MSTKRQFAQALHSSAEAGFPIILNVMTCCRGCTTDRDVEKAYNKQAEEFGLPSLTFDTDAPNAVWHFGGQGNQITFRNTLSAEMVEEDECSCYDEEDEYDEDEDGNEILVREGESIECDICRNGPKYTSFDGLMLNHSTNEAAEAAIKALREAGFSVEWDGSKMTCISVH